MIVRISLFCSLLFIVTSCKTLSINQNSVTNTTQQIPIGSMGLDKDFLLQKDFNNVAMPSYKEPIKLSVLLKPFSKPIYKSFLKAKGSQSASVNINYIDSLEIKPKFLQFKIADKVSVIEALNKDTNQGVKNYLSHNKYTNIVNMISIAFNKKDIELIQQADGVFLVENGLKNYALQLYTGRTKGELIRFNQGIVFAFETSNCCWQENKRRKLDIVDYVSKYNGCPNKTYRSAERAKKETKLF